ncbi:Hypothetical protein FKW44_008508 [Caligus rogercresseyi]|uniref:Uncharacterized protein n=1 Tax=Caligus rogercresseyi TaxID=217165 RepID=A0A7T8KG88_CALRO|nr:Hypothetical protein FKW44_008508 [Caligus rogercresseyi]
MNRGTLNGNLEWLAEKINTISNTSSNATQPSQCPPWPGFGHPQDQRVQRGLKRWVEKV